MVINSQLFFSPVESKKYLSLQEMH